MRCVRRVDRLEKEVFGTRGPRDSNLRDEYSSLRTFIAWEERREQYAIDGFAQIMKELEQRIWLMEQKHEQLVCAHDKLLVKHENLVTNLPSLYVKGE